MSIAEQFASTGFCIEADVATPVEVAALVTAVSPKLSATGARGGVRERRDVPGFAPWSEKDGAPHVQPPVELSNAMVAVRMHLDDCTSENGPVRVLPGSHRAGRLGAAQIDAWRGRVSEVECTVPAGGVLAFHSLLLHASSPARVPLHRRVVHIEYVGRNWRRLPGDLQWHEAS